MGRCYHPVTIPYVLHSQTPNTKDTRLEISWEEPEEWGFSVNGWEPQGEGDIVGETLWKKGDLLVEVGYADLTMRSETFFASKSREALGAWKRDHKLKGKIEEGETVVLHG